MPSPLAPWPLLLRPIADMIYPGVIGRRGGMVWDKRELSTLVQNVRAGARIALFRRDALKHIRVSADQVFYLAVLDVLIVFALAWVEALPRPEFNAWGFASAGLGFAALFAVGYLFARLYRKKLSLPVSWSASTASPHGSR